MSKVREVIYLIVFSLVLAGCAETIDTTVSIFKSPYADISLGKKIYIKPMDDNQKNSLEFVNFSSYVYSKFVAAGYKIALSEKDSDLVAFVTYGVDSGRLTTRSVPVYGQVGGGRSYYSGKITKEDGSREDFDGTTTHIPTYGVVGVTQESHIEYKRDINIDVYKPSKGNHEKVLEVRASSIGKCGNISAVSRYIVDGIFEAFPNAVIGKNGTTKVEVKLDKDLAC